MGNEANLEDSNMSSNDPLSKPKADYGELIARIGSPESPVGIDAVYTHAIIIEYLRQISTRLEKLEALIQKEDATTP